VKADRGGTTFASLRHSRNFRLYFYGQAVSLAGTWMQTIAQGWLVLQLTGSASLLGLVTACQFLPVLFFGPFGGVIVDRVDTRRLLILTQALSGALALALGILTVTGVVQLWMVFAMAIGLGIVTVADNPARQTFVLELVGPDLVSNAVTLNSVNINAARVVGPAIAAVMIAGIGVGPCFIVNAASFLAVIGALMVMTRADFHPKVLAVRAKGQVREGFRYVWHNPSLRTPLLMMFLIGTLAYEFQVVLPVLAKTTFGGGAGTYGIMSAAMGLGAVFGGLVVAGKDRHGLDALVRVSLFFGATIALLAVSPTLPVAILALVVVGMASITFLARANTTLQLAADPVMRGRVMALWTVAFLGSTPIGGPIVGVIAEYAGPRWALVTAAASCFGAAALGASRAWSSVTRRWRAQTATTA
jgi:MFS family permease